MGCCQSRVERQCRLSEMEDLLLHCEAELGFHLVSAEEIRLRLVNYWPRWTISRKVILRILEKQRLTSTGAEELNGPLGELLHCIREGSEYSIRKFVLIAVMLSADSIRVKACILYGMYHISEGQWMTLEETELIAEEALEIALFVLPRYAEVSLEAARSEEAMRKMTRFIALLQHGKDFVYRALRKDLKSVKELSESEFIQKLTKEPAIYLCSARSLRKFAYTMAVQKRMKTIELENRIMDEDLQEKTEDQPKSSSTITSNQLGHRSAGTSPISRTIQPKST